MMRINKRWLALLMTAALALMGLGISASADAGMEAEFLSKINASRSAAGLGSLKSSGSLSSYARGHSGDMADAGAIFHSTSGQLSSAAGSGWTKVGENVGKGPSVDSLHNAFMNSAGHKANILGAYDTAGVGVALKDGYIYVTVVFVNYGTGGGSSGSGGSSGGSTATTKPVVTTTTLPPTTTTTLIVGPDKEVTPGVDCIQANRFWQMCHD